MPVSRLLPPLVALLLAASPLCAGTTAGDDAVRLNQIQVVGTHNSYHSGFAPSAARLLEAKAPKAYRSLDYRHPALARQLDDGVRQLEIDVYADAKGGLYAHPAMDRLIAQAGLPADPPMNDVATMDKPGFKVMHVEDIDQRSSCQPFTACLAEIRAWSKAHPRHLPLFILVETKDKPLRNVQFKPVAPEPFTTAVFDALDRAVTSVFPRAEIVTPDDVRGGHATLPAAVAHGGWPTLAQARGKVVFLLDQKPASPAYLKGHPALRGRVFFTDAAPGRSDAAFIECNMCSAGKIDAQVRQGYLVRTRTDDPAQGQGQHNDTRRRDAVLDSGAQMLSTDYPAGEPAASGYAVGFPGQRTLRCNPVLKPAGCDDDALER